MNSVGNSEETRRECIEKTSKECDEKIRIEWAEKCHICENYLVQRKRKINYRHYFGNTGKSCKNMACFSLILKQVDEKAEAKSQYRGLQLVENFVLEGLKSTEVGSERHRQLSALNKVLVMLKNTRIPVKNQSLAGSGSRPPIHPARSQRINTKTVVQPRKRRSKAIVAPTVHLFNRLFEDIPLLNNDGTTVDVHPFDSHCLPYGESRIKWFEGFETKLEVECGVEPSFLPGIFFTTLSVFSRSIINVDEKKRQHRVLLCNVYQGWEDKNSSAPLGTWGFITRTGNGEVECILRSANPGPGSGSGLGFTLGCDADSFEAAVVGFWPMKLSNNNLSASFHRTVEYDREYNWYAQAWDIGRKVIDYSGLSKERKRLKYKPFTDFDALYKNFDDEVASFITERSRSTSGSTGLALTQTCSSPSCTMNPS